MNNETAHAKGVYRVVVRKHKIGGSVLIPYSSMKTNFCRCSSIFSKDVKNKGANNNMR